MTAKRDPYERSDTKEAADPIENAENAEPIDPTDRTEPTEPIDSTDPLEPIDRNESSDHSDHREPEPLRDFMNASCPAEWSRGNADSMKQLLNDFPRGPHARPDRTIDRAVADPCCLRAGPMDPSHRLA